jgi:hypothetical protein
MNTRTVEVTDLSLAELHHPLVLDRKSRAQRSKRLLLRSNFRQAGLAASVAVDVERERAKTWGEWSSSRYSGEQTTRLGIAHELAGSSAIGCRASCQP